MLYLEDLKALISFQETGSLTKTAETLNISQPTLTRVMQRLELEFEVPLFNRTKNKITLNENGKIAAHEALKILTTVNTSLTLVQTINRQNQSIKIGSCAPIPLNQMVQITKDFFSETKVEAELNNEIKLINGLYKGEYQIIILPKKIQEEDIYCKKYGEETLMFLLPNIHPLADKVSVYMNDLDGEVMLLLSDIGFWSNIPKEKMPNSKFLLQNERFAFYELVHSSTLPNFTTDLAIKRDGIPEGRVAVPILDKEAKVTYYLCCLEMNKKIYQNLLLNSMIT